MFRLMVLLISFMSATICSAAAYGSGESSLAEHADVLEKIALYYLCATMTGVGLILLWIFGQIMSLRDFRTQQEQKCKDYHDEGR